MLPRTQRSWQILIALKISSRPVLCAKNQFQAQPRQRCLAAIVFIWTACRRIWSSSKTPTRIQLVQIAKRSSCLLNVTWWKWSPNKLTKMPACRGTTLLNRTRPRSSLQLRNRLQLPGNSLRLLLSNPCRWRLWSKNSWRPNKWAPIYRNKTKELKCWLQLCKSKVRPKRTYNKNLMIIKFKIRSCKRW